MDTGLYNSIDKRIFSTPGKAGDNFLLIKHYNTLSFTAEDAAQIKARNADTVVCLHDFKLAQMAGVFEPFLCYARTLVGMRSGAEIDRILEACNVYSLHRSVLRSYLMTGECVREEEILIDEVAFEQDRIASAVVKLILYLTREKKIVFLLNDLQYASGSSMHFIHNMVEEAAGRKLAVIATYNEAKVSLPHIVPLWNRFYNYVYGKELVMETIYGSLDRNEEQESDYAVSAQRLGDDIREVNNLLFCLDFSQASYYLGIMYKMMTVEEIDIAWEDRMRILNLYALVSIYTQDISQALLLCGKIREIKERVNQPEVDFEYYYFIGLTHMYNGKLEEAAQGAKACLAAAQRQGEERHIFVARMLYLMIQMSGWHNIFFCANDIAVDEELLQLARKYNYWNHLGHIYVYAYDNSPALFSDETRLEERLVHFNKGIDIMKRLGNEYFIMEAYRNNIMIASTNGFFRTANYYYDKCHEMVRGKSAHEEAMVYNGVGYISSAMEAYDKAFACYHEALRRFMALEEIDYVGETLYNMAINCIMAQDYHNALQYLEIAFRIVKEMKMNSLRVCNISKLTGLMAFCSHYSGNDLMCAVYTEKTRLFLEHLTEGDNTAAGGRRNILGIVHDYTLCKDDLFIYYYMAGIQFAKSGEDGEALRALQLAAGCMDEAVGNQFYIFRQYIETLARLYRRMGKEKEAVQRLQGAIAFYEAQGCRHKVRELQAQLSGRRLCEEKHNLGLSMELEQEIYTALRHASVHRENQEQQKRMTFLSAWQKMMEINNKNRQELVLPAINAFIHHFNIDRLMLLKYEDNEPRELFNNTGFAFTGERRRGVEAFFHKKHLGFVVSKIDNNYSDYSDIVFYFEQNKICSMIGLPFYCNDSFQAIVIAYITMKDNWHSLNNRYLLDKSDYTVFEFLIRQLLNAIEMLETKEAIQQMNDKLNYLAVTDKLTGLYNREGFYDNIERRIAGRPAGNQAQPITILYIDLDNFKHYNDTYGHAAGDIILVEMAGIFRREVGQEGFVARYGGDEFLAAVYSDDRPLIERIAGNIYAEINAADGFKAVIEQKLGKTIDIPRDKTISCSIGISSIGALTSSEALETVVKEADKVLYDVKKSGKGIFKFYA